MEKEISINTLKELTIGEVLALTNENLSEIEIPLFTYVSKPLSAQDILDEL